MSGKEERLAVSLSGGGPWGFRLRGGAGTGSPLVVHKVRRKSKAYRHLREGDRILCVNGRSCDALTYDQLMDIADKSGTDLTLDILRRECDKENRAPGLDSEAIGEDRQLLSFVETSSKTHDEKEGLRIKSVMPEFEAAVEPFPCFRDLQQTEPCASSKQEVVSGDDNSYTRTSVEERREVKGDTETSFSKTESFSKSSGDSHGLPDITMDTIDLNNLISETQKRLESFRNNFVGNGLSDSCSLGDVRSTRAVEASLRKESASLAKSEEPEVSKKDPPFSLPDIGFGSQSSETCTTAADIPFGSTTTTLTKKKKMFSSSSFYEEPDSIYPTVEEQVEMARKIADSLADDTNRKSKGANMFYKRVKTSTKWIHEGPEPSDESGPGTPEVQGGDASPFRPSRGPPKLKLVLDPRHPLDLAALRSSGYVISEHNVVSPEVCHGLVKDLQSPVGKGAALFAKRKKKSEEWVVDEEKVKALLRQQQEKKFAQPIPRQDVKLVKSPWEAAMESPYGLCDPAFFRVHPDQLADTVMKRADSIRSESRESSRMEGCISPPPLTTAASPYDVYHAKAPKGWAGSAAPYAFDSPQLPPVSSPTPQTKNGFQPPSKKMVFQNFNAVPRLWKGSGGLH